MKLTRPVFLLLAYSLLGSTSLALAGSNHPEQVGWVERLAFDEGRILLKAKLDSGAKTSSINAEKIERFEKDGEDWVRFELVLKTVDGDFERLEMERPLFRNVRIKEHEGKNDRRPVVKLDFCFNGKKRTAQFTLVDRSKFIYPVLLGRRFLADRVVINPGRVHMTAPECRYKAKDDAGDEKSGSAESTGKSGGKKGD